MGIKVVLLLLAATATAHAYTYTSWHECSAQAVYGGIYGAEVLSNLSDFRSGLLSQVWKSFDPTVPYAKGFQIFDPVRPFIKCPPHQPLIRYGNPADGGKLLCDVSKLPTPCLIYSLGSNGDYSFEQDMLKNTQCEIHTFDCTYDGKSQDEKRHVYHKWCVGAQKTENFKTWDEITRLLGHQHRTLDVFKIDIEGHEPGVLAELRHDTPLPRQIVIELHMYATDRPTAIQKPAPRTPAQLSLLVMHMASLGYGVVGQEDNIWGEPGCCAEWTFLHVERPWAGAGARLAAFSRHRRQAALQNGTEPAAAAAGGRRLQAAQRNLQHAKPESGSSGASAVLGNAFAGLQALFRR